MTLPRVPALDGVRGLAVLAVLAFHAGYLQGGFLGVDLFFVLSGFLITGLLIAEHQHKARISLTEFWVRRARRLLPALLLLLVAIAMYAQWLAAPIELDAIRRDGLATSFYVANWVQIGAGVSYWDAFKAPSPLQHTWSLAIEEQFYLAWPAVVWLVLRFARGSLRTLAGVTAVLAAGSIVAMQLLYQPGGDSSRAYFGSDTRASSLLFGALAAIAYATRRAPVRRSVLPVISVLTVAGVAAAWTTASGTSAWLYRWGLPLSAAASAVTVYAIAVGAAGRGLTSALSVRPLRHIGAISYGLYLWHWPVQVVLTPERVHVDELWLLALRVAVTFAIAEASYHLVEMPIRRGALRGWSIRVATPAAIGVTVIAVIVATSAAFVIAPPVLRAAAVADQDTTSGDGLRVMVVGDSGAVYLGQGISAAATVEVVGDFGEVGCGLPRDGEGLETDDGRLLPDPEGCHDWPARWAAEARSFHPDVALLNIAWAGDGDREIEGALRHPCDAVFDAHYADEVRLAIDTLHAAGAAVLVTTTPYTLDAYGSQDRVDCLNHSYRTAVATRPGARIVDLAVWLCAGGACRYEINGTTLRPDGMHFDGPGATIAGGWLLDEADRLSPDPVSVSADRRDR